MTGRSPGYSRVLAVDQRRQFEMPLDMPHPGFEVAYQKTVVSAMKPSDFLLQKV